MPGGAPQNGGAPDEPSRGQPADAAAPPVAGATATATRKREDAFRSIGEVAALIGVAPHVLRYWETQFPQLKPMKRPDGRRYYRPDDLRLAAGLCVLLRDDGLTIRGARKLIAPDRGAAVRARGDARLAGRPPALAEAEAERPHQDEPAAAAPPPPEAAPIPPSAAPQEDAIPDHDDTGPAATPPLPRLRLRQPPPAAGQLALFDGPPPPAADWLPRLTRLARLLAEVPPGSPRWQRAAPTALRLGRAIAQLY